MADRLGDRVRELAGNAVSRQIIGTSRSMCSRATLMPSAVCGSTTMPWRSCTVRIVRMRSLCVLRPDTSPLALTSGQIGVPPK